MRPNWGRFSQRKTLLWRSFRRPSRRYGTVWRTAGKHRRTCGTPRESACRIRRRRRRKSRHRGSPISPRGVNRAPSREPFPDRSPRTQGTGGDTPPFSRRRCSKPRMSRMLRHTRGRNECKPHNSVLHFVLPSPSPSVSDHIAQERRPDPSVPPRCTGIPLHLSPCRS